MNRTEIKDLPVPEKELTEGEAKQIQGGIVRPVAGGTTTDFSLDTTDNGPTYQNDVSTD